MTHIIETIKESHFSQVLALWKKTAGLGLDDICDSVPGLNKFLRRNPNGGFVALDKDSVVGAVLCSNDGRRGFLYHLAVDDKYRKKGIGRDLVQNCIVMLKKEGIHKCSIFLFKSNSSGRAFWKQCGWNERDDLSIMQHMTFE